jgi:hypothetical protein
VRWWGRPELIADIGLTPPGLRHSWRRLLNCNETIKLAAVFKTWHRYTTTCSDALTASGKNEGAAPTTRNEYDCGTTPWTGSDPNLADHTRLEESGQLAAR